MHRKRIDLINSLLLIQKRLKNPSTHAVELQNMRVKLPQRRPMRNREQRYAHVLCRLVDGAFDIDRYCRRALVEECILRSVANEKIVVFFG